MARALQVFSVICVIVLTVVMINEVSHVDEPTGKRDTPGAVSDSKERSRPSGEPRLKIRPERARSENAPETTGGASDEEGRWRVVVLSAEDEQPIEGAILEAWPSHDIGGTPQRLGMTDANGILEVVTPRVAVVLLYVRKRGFIRARRDLWWAGEPIRLQPGLPVAGRVLNPDDAPIAGATVRIWDADNKYELSRPLTTDEAGRFEVDGVPPNRPFVVIASADAFAPRAVELTITRPKHGLIVRLGGGGVLVGTVMRHDGTPAAGLEVRLLPPRDPIPEGAQAELARFRTPLIQTDSEGRYGFSDVPLQKEFEVCVRVSKTYEGRSGPLRFARAGEKQQRDVRLLTPASLLVTVVTDAGQEVDAEQVSLRNHLGDFDPGDRKQKGDRWHFPELTPGDYELFVFVVGWPFKLERLTLRAGEAGIKRVVMRRGLTVSGVVVDSRGGPLAGAYVWWVDGTTTATAFGETDEAGRFEFGGLEEAPGKLVVRSLPGHAESGRALADLELEGVVPGGDPLRIVLKPLGTIRGRFPALAQGTSMPVRAISRSLWGGSKTTLEAGGRFECPVPIAREPYLLLFRREGYAPLLVDREAMEPAQDVDLGDLRFDQGFTLEAVVEDEQGKPVAGAAVAIAEQWSGDNTRTDADGRFAFKRAPKRAICLRVDAKAYPMHLFRVDGRAFNPGVRLVLRGGGELLGTVLTSSGEPAAGADVTIVPNVASPYDSDHDETATSVKCDAKGRFQVQLQFGAYEVRVYDEGLRLKGSARVDIQDGGTSAVEVRLK